MSILTLKNYERDDTGGYFVCLATRIIGFHFMERVKYGYIHAAIFLGRINMN